MLHFVKTNANNKILKQLIYANCLSFGRNPKLNNKKINHYIFGARQKFDIFKFYEMRYLLLKIYPLIHNLFLQSRLNKTKKKKRFFNKDFDFQTKSLPKSFRNSKTFQDLKDKFNRTLKEKTSRSLLPQILFATTTNIYSEIVSSAAKKCRMPFHVNRWLSGTVTAATFYKNDVKRWSFLANTCEENYTALIVQNKFFKHKKKFELQKNKLINSQSIIKPVLIIIPDVSNNEMILKETNSLGIPAIGLVNSHCGIEIAYPIFANDFSFYSVHFFCHFLSSLIIKEFVKFKRKIFTNRKILRNAQFIQAKNDIFSLNKRIFCKKAYTIKNMFKKSFIKTYKKKIGDQNFSKKKSNKKEIQAIKTNFQKAYKKKVLTLKNFVINYFKTKAYKKRINTLQKHFFKGKYFVEHFSKARRKIKRKIRNKKKPNQKFKMHLKKKSLPQITSPKKLILVENLKRFSKNKTKFYLKKRILKKMELIHALRHYNFTKIMKEIRLPNNKPKFRYWNKKTFWFSTPIKFASTLPSWYTFKRFKLNKIIHQTIWKQKRKQREEFFYLKKKNQNLLKKQNYRKRWSTKKVKKGKLK